MSILVGLSIGVTSVITFGGLIKFSLLVSKRVVSQYKRKKKKKKLKKEIADSIDNANYHNFVNVIYEIKTYDDKYNKNLYVKCKNQYSFREIHYSTLKNFSRRFSDNYEEQQQMFEEMVKSQIELSLSLLKNQSVLDL